MVLLSITSGGSCYWNTVVFGFQEVFISTSSGLSPVRNGKIRIVTFFENHSGAGLAGDGGWGKLSARDGSMPHDGGERRPGSGLLRKPRKEKIRVKEEGDCAGEHPETCGISLNAPRREGRFTRAVGGFPL